MTKSLDDDNVVIVEQKPQGLFAKTVGAVKGLFNKKKKPETEKTDSGVTETGEEEPTQD